MTPRYPHAREIMGPRPRPDLNPAQEAYVRDLCDQLHKAADFIELYLCGDLLEDPSGGEPSA